MPSPTFSSVSSLNSTKRLLRDSKGGNCQPAWEEPHPGRRLSLPGESSQPCDQSVAQRGECRGGMAAKVLDVQSRTIKRRARLRSRKQTLKPLIIPAEVPEELEGKDTNAITSCAWRSMPSVSSDPATKIKRSSIVRPESGAIQQVEEVTPTFNLPLLSDFSNHLDIKVDDEEDDIATVVDPTSYQEVSATDDFYGWEAELKRRHTAEVSLSHSLIPYSQNEVCQFRRADGSKKSLLYRVLSLGQGIRGSTTDCPTSG